jgi:hypothetical protein
MAIVSAVVLLELFFLPETYRVEQEHPLDTLENEGEDADASSSKTLANRSFTNPFKAVLLLKHPVILLSSIEIGMVFGLMFSSKSHDRLCFKPCLPFYYQN